MEATRFDQKGCTSEAEIVEESGRTKSFGGKGLFSLGHIYFDEQLLPQINVCYEEIMQNNEMTSLVTQSLLDACSI